MSQSHKKPLAASSKIHRYGTGVAVSWYFHVNPNKRVHLQMGATSFSPHGFSSDDEESSIAKVPEVNYLRRMQLYSVS